MQTTYLYTPPLKDPEALALSLRGVTLSENPTKKENIPEEVVSSEKVENSQKNEILQSLSQKIIEEFQSNGKSKEYLLLLKEFAINCQSAKSNFFPQYAGIQSSECSEEIVKSCNEDLEIITTLIQQKGDEHYLRPYAKKAVTNGFNPELVYELAGISWYKEHQKNMDELHFKIAGEFKQNGRSDQYLFLIQERIKQERSSRKDSYFLFEGDYSLSEFGKELHEDVTSIEKLIYFPRNYKSCTTDFADAAYKRGFPTESVKKLAMCFIPLDALVCEFKTNGRSEKYLMLLQEFITIEKEIGYLYRMIPEEMFPESDERNCIKDAKIIYELFIYKDSDFGKSYCILRAIERGFKESDIDYLLN